MNKSVSDDTPRFMEWEPKFPFDLVVAYEDGSTRDRAMLLYDRIGQQLLDDYDFQCAWWKFDHLREPTLMEQAIDDAAQAHMVIVSVRGGKRLPGMAREWFDSWIPYRARHRSALVALVHDSPPRSAGASSLHAYLQQVARQARMDFFLHTAEEIHRPSLYSFRAVDERADTMTPFLENILHPHSSAVLRAY